MLYTKILYCLSFIHNSSGCSWKSSFYNTCFYGEREFLQAKFPMIDFSQVSYALNSHVQCYSNSRFNFPDLISKQWQDIGFQGDDPRTDFRGMGMLGLDQLVFFTTQYNSLARHVLSRSLHPTFGYSFAIVGEYYHPNDIDYFYFT